MAPRSLLVYQRTSRIFVAQTKPQLLELSNLASFESTTWLNIFGYVS
ncbi:MAG: hypothetical protein IGS39_22785 [Calothrix sp. C42_A2020_038]|nr:hypothetical protein [Calothrix sp. C42_A2020_038]